MPEVTRSKEFVWQDPLASVAPGAEMTGLEYILAISSGEIPPPPIAILLVFGLPRGSVYRKGGQNLIGRASLKFLSSHRLHSFA